MKRPAFAVLLYAFSGCLAAGGAAGPAAPDDATDARSFRDWVLTCREECQIGTSVKSEAEATEVLRLEVTQAAEAEGRRQLAVVTPLPLYLPDPPSLTLGSGELRQLVWRTCGSAGCEAVVPLGADLLSALRRERGGSVGFTLLDGVRVRLAFSLMGFTAAYEALGVSPDS